MNKQSFMFIVLVLILFYNAVIAKEFVRVAKNKRQAYGVVGLNSDWANGASNNNGFSGSFPGLYNDGSSKFGSVSIHTNPYFNSGSSMSNIILKKGPVTFQPSQQFTQHQSIKLHAAPNLPYKTESYFQPQNQKLTYYPSHTTYNTPTNGGLSFGSIKHNSIFPAFSGLHSTENRDIVPVYATGIKGLGHYAAPQFQHETPSIPTYAHNFGFQSVSKDVSDNGKISIPSYQVPLPSKNDVPTYAYSTAFSNNTPDKMRNNNVYYLGGLLQSTPSRINKIQQPYTIPNPSILSSLPSNFNQHGPPNDANYGNSDVLYANNFVHQNVGLSKSQNYNTISYSVPSN